MVLQSHQTPIWRQHINSKLRCPPKRHTMSHSRYNCHQTLNIDTDIYVPTCTRLFLVVDKWSSLNNKIEKAFEWQMCCYFTFHKSNFNHICSFFHTFEVKIGRENCNILSAFFLEKLNWTQEFTFLFRRLFFSFVWLCIIFLGISEQM
jgi:hypothetical protein